MTKKKLDERGESTISEAISINPKHELKKGTDAKYVSMAEINPNQKSVTGWIVRPFTGGSKFKNGDTLLARITPCLENGKTAYVNFLGEDEIGWGSTEFIILTGKDGITDNDYVYYLAKSSEFRNVAIASMTGTSGRQRVQESVFYRTKMYFPPFPEQHAISRILSSLDDKIELNRQMNSILEQVGQALFKRWFVDFEFPDENGKPYKSSGGKMADSELGEIPNEWTIKPIDEIAEFLNGLALQKYPPADERYLPVIKIRELRQGTTESSDKASPDIDKEYVVEDGDVLFSWSGSLDVCVWCGGKGALNQHLFKVTSKNYPKWFYYYWTRFHLPGFQHIAEGKATTMGHIQRHHLSSTLVVVPPENMLREMSKTMDSLLKQFIRNSIEARNLAAIRDALLPKLMSGAIRVSVKAWCR